MENRAPSQEWSIVIYRISSGECNLRRIGLIGQSRGEKRAESKRCILEMRYRHLHHLHGQLCLSHSLGTLEDGEQELFLEVELTWQAIQKDFPSAMDSRVSKIIAFSGILPIRPLDSRWSLDNSCLCLRIGSENFSRITNRSSFI